MRSSPPEQSNKPSVAELRQALDAAAQSLLFADAGDLLSVEHALDRLEIATSKLRDVSLDGAHHAPLREQLDRASHATYRLLEQLIESRDEIGSRLARIRARRTFGSDSLAEPEPKIDLTS